MAPRALETAKVEGDPQTYEDHNVHAVYDEIAAHFSSTRYKVSLPEDQNSNFPRSTFVRAAMACNRQLHLQS